MLIGKGIIKLCFTLTEYPEEILENRDVQITISSGKKKKKEGGDYYALDESRYMKRELPLRIVLLVQNRK